MGKSALRDQGLSNLKLVGRGRATISIWNYIDYIQKKALFWGYNDLFEGENSDLGSNKLSSDN